MLKHHPELAAEAQQQKWQQQQKWLQQWQLQQLSSAMKSNSETPAIERCREMLDQSGLLEQGLSDSIRPRLLKVWATLEPTL